MTAAPGAGRAFPAAELKPKGATFYEPTPEKPEAPPPASQRWTVTEAK